MGSATVVVNVAIGLSVVGSVATSVAATAAGAAAGAAGGAAGGAGAGGGSGGAAGGAAVALVFGAQRFAVSSSVADGVSTTQSELASEMSWATGDFGIGRPPSAAPRSRRLALSDEGSKAVASLLNILLIWGVVMLCTIAVHAYARWLWKHKVNKRYYARRRGSFGSLPQRDKFKPFPSAFVFPCLTMTANSLFLTGLVASSVRCLVLWPEIGPGWRVLPVATLALVCAYHVFTFSVLYRFNARFREATWKPCTYPDTPTLVVDPAYRLLSWLRIKCCNPDGRRQLILDRPRGKFARPADEIVEPARTGRLLYAPVDLFRANAADTLDVVGFALMARSGGDYPHSVFFEHSALSAQMLVAIVSALCADLVPGSAPATALMVGVSLIQFGVAGCILTTSPSADRLMSLLVGVQFLIEGLVTWHLLIVALRPEWADLEGVKANALALALLALLAPVLQRLYDATIVQISKIVRKNGFSLKAAAFAFVGFVVFLPTIIAKWTGLDSKGDSATNLKFVEGAGDDVNKLATKTANEGVVTQIEAGLAEIASNLFWVASQEKSRRDRMRRKSASSYHDAAVVIQRAYRKRRARRKSAAVQRWQRGHKHVVPTLAGCYSDAGCRSRRPATRPTQHTTAPEHSTTPVLAIGDGDRAGGARPGFAWIQQQMAELEDDATENIESASASHAGAPGCSGQRCRAAGRCGSFPAKIYPVRAEHSLR